MIVTLDLKQDLDKEKRHRKDFDEEIPEKITALTREKVDSYGQNIWEVSTNLWKILVLLIWVRYLT